MLLTSVSTMQSQVCRLLPLSILSKGSNCLGLMLSYLHETVREALLTCRHVTARRRTPGPPLSKGIVVNRPGTLPVTSHTRTRPSSCPVKYKSLLPGDGLAGWGRSPPEKTHLHLLAVPAALAIPRDCPFNAYTHNHCCQTTYTADCLTDA